MTIREIFEKYKTIAVYGMSKNPAKPSNYVPAFLIEKGYDIIPVNPTANEIDGRKCYSKMADIPGEIDILNVFRPSEQALAVVEEAVERRKQRGDIRVVWLQEGIESEEAAALAEANGIEFIQDRCMLREYKGL